MDGHKLVGEKIYINVGTRPRIPQVKGIEYVPWMDSAGLLDKETFTRAFDHYWRGLYWRGVFTNFQAVSVLK